MYSLLTVKDETQTRHQTTTTYDWSTYYTTRGEERYELCLSNKGLGYSKYMKGADRSRLAAEARLLENKWDKEWKAHQANNTLNQVYETLNRLLVHTLTIDDAIDFENLKITSTNCTKPLLQEIPEPSFSKLKDFKEWEFENYNITQESVKPYSFINLQRSLILIAGHFIFGPGFVILFLLFLFAKDFKKISKKTSTPSV